MVQALDIVFFGGGNANLKLIASGKRRTYEALMPHALARLSENEWKMEQSRNRARTSSVAKSQTFGMVSRAASGKEQTINYFKVGASASENRGKARLGSYKYEYDYMDALLVAMLLDAFPDGHDNIALGVSYPPSEVSHADLLRKLVGGTHKAVRLDGKRVKFNVKYVLAIDEPVGGVAWLNARHATLLKQAKSDGEGALNLRAGQKVLTLDIGGYIGSMGSAIVGDDGLIIPEWQTYRAIQGGILTIMETLEAELKADFSEEFRGMSIPRDMLEDALVEGGIYLSGSDTPLLVRETVERSLALIDDIQNMYETYFDGGRRHRAIVCFGGGMKSLFGHVKEILAHNNVKLADSLNEIHMAEPRGGWEVSRAKFEKDGVQ